MVSINQIEHGLGRWVDAQLLPLLPTGGPYDNLKRMGVAAGAVYLIRKGKTALTSLQGSSFLTALGAIDGNGDIDLEGIKDVLKEKIPSTGLKVTVPLLNEITIFPADIEQMYSYIMGG